MQPDFQEPIGIDLHESGIAAPSTSGQLQYASGQSIAPEFAGWVANSDGSFDMVFGYMNRNYEEHPHVPIGPNNKFEPGEIDRGQPTYFLPRRNGIRSRGEGEKPDGYPTDT